MSTSPTSGALRITLGPSPSIAATMCLVTAFFDPRTSMSPRSGPEGSTSQVPVTQATLRLADRSAGLYGQRRRVGGRGRRLPVERRPGVEPADEPVSGGDCEDRAHRDAERGGRDADVLQAGREDHERDRGPDVAVGRP